MIRKILVRDYLKGVDDMTAEERKAFVGRVGEWLVRDGMRLVAMTDRPLARSQSLMTVTTRWTAEDCRAMAEGIMLMSALVGVADTWLPTQIYMRSAYRAVRQVVEVLSTVNAGNGVSIAVGKFVEKKRTKDCVEYEFVGEPASKGGDTIAGQLTKKIGAGMGGQTRPAPAGKTQGTEAAQTEKPLPMIKTVGKEYDAATDTVRVQCAVVPARPKHIGQYVHLLPKATQERAAGYGELMRQLSEARDNMQLLMDDDHASAKSREQWAKQTTKIDNKIRALKEELNREWDKVVADNRIALDAFGNAYVVEMRNEKGEMRNDDADDENSAISHQPSALSSEQRKRRRDLRKWLIDLRRGKEGKDREKRIEQWRVNWLEYLTLEPKEKALEDEKILEAAKHFGIDLTQILAMASVTLAGCRAATN